MKRLVCAVLAILMIAVCFTGCKVNTTVDEKYVDEFVNDYAVAEENEDGSVDYEFESKDKYEEFIDDYYYKVQEDSRLEIKSSGQYSYYNPDITQVIVGVTPESWEEMGEEALKAEAQAVGEVALKYQMNTKNPSGEVEVTYRDANTSEEYFTITVEAE